MKNELELKLKLAEELSHEIRIHTLACNPPKYDFEWIKDGTRVTEREWDWVVWKLWQNRGARNLCEGSYYDEPWQQRAEAYFKVKGKQ